MFHVSNRSCIRTLSKKSFKSSKTRNLIAILGIALTTILFTALFTIGFSMNDAFQNSNFRQIGGFSHGGFKSLTEQQFLELREDPLIKEWGVSRVLGFSQDSALRKNQVEVRWSDDRYAHWSFSDPIVGRLPKENTNEAATDLEILHLLGIEPKLGAEFTITIDVEGTPTKQSFILSGWWEKDPIMIANQILIPESRINSVLQELEISLPTENKMIGSWNMDIMFQNSRHIEKNLNTILHNHGYQSENKQDPNYIDYGVNWGYTNAQLSQNADPLTVVLVILLLLIIIFTGYLIIYNIFQISVINDIRFYGLLKTIGTTGKQIKSILRFQAMMLCAWGIPLGWLGGWFIGAWLTPIILRHLNDVIAQTISIRPMIFFCAAGFSLLTVLLSCARPGRLAAKISPIETVRYTEVGKIKKIHKNTGKTSVLHMAWANLGRCKGKTFVTILSLTLSVVLLQMTTLFTNGFDMDKYLQDKAICDFILADGGYFKNNLQTWNSGQGILTEEVISTVTTQNGITKGGRIYGQLDGIQQFAPRDWVQQNMMKWGNTEENVQFILSHSPQTEDGRVMDRVQTYGMDPFILDKLTVWEGDISNLYKPGSHAVAAVYHADDYNQIKPNSNWAKVGDVITLRVPEKWEYYSPQTGEVYDTPEAFGKDEGYLMRPSVYRDETFTVEALVQVPYTLSYRYFGADEFILNGDSFQKLTGKSDVMLYAFDTDTTTATETFLNHYTQTVNPRYGYESKQSYVEEFENFRSMFLLIGSLLSFIIGLIGILNFANAILTGILTRKRELAILQSIGMTGKQLKTMLMTEGLLYALSSAILAFCFSLVMNLMAAEALDKIFWFFSYTSDFTPILILTPIFAVIGCIIPLVVYHSVARKTIVERLRITTE